MSANGKSSATPRLLLVVDCYFPSTKSAAKLMIDLALEFVELGYSVTVLTVDENAVAPFQVDLESGILVCRVRSGKLKGASRFERAINEVQLSRLIWRKAGSFFVQNRHDYIVYYSPTIFFGPLISRLKALWAAPAYLILRDIFPEWAVDAGILRRGLMYKYFKTWERRNYDAADVIGVQSANDLPYISRQMAGRPVQLEVLRNWMRPLDFELPAIDLRQELKIDNKVLFFYGGNIGQAQDMGNLLHLAGCLKHRDDIHFVFVGDGSEAGWLSQRIHALALSNTSWLPAVDQNTYFSMLNSAEIGLISLDRRLKSNNIPGKLLGYLYFGKPTLASVNPGNELHMILDESQSGYVVDNGDDAGLLAAAEALARDDELRRRMGDNARALLTRTFASRAAAIQVLAAIGTGPKASNRLFRPQLAFEASATDNVAASASTAQIKIS